jgi:hypothetical protein
VLPGTRTGGVDAKTYACAGGEIERVSGSPDVEPFLIIEPGT